MVADHVYSDSVTGKKVVAGIFQNLYFGKIEAKVPETSEGQGGQAQIAVPSGGMQIGSPFCYLSLTEVRSNSQFELRYVDLDDEKVHFGTRFEIVNDDPLKTIELVFPLPVLPVNKAGTFALELLWNNEPLSYYRITVQELGSGGK